jgi:hypothetical protein
MAMGGNEDIKLELVMWLLYDLSNTKSFETMDNNIEEKRYDIPVY